MFWAGSLGSTDATSEPQIGADLLSSGVDLGSIKEINSTFVGDGHEPFSNLQEGAKVSQKSQMLSKHGK